MLPGTVGVTVPASIVVEVDAGRVVIGFNVWLVTVALVAAVDVPMIGVHSGTGVLSSWATTACWALR
jgi:hypothetical protein